VTGITKLASVGAVLFLIVGAYAVNTTLMKNSNVLDNKNITKDGPSSTADTLSDQQYMSYRQQQAARIRPAIGRVRTAVAEKELSDLAVVMLKTRDTEAVSRFEVPAGVPVDDVLALYILKSDLAQYATLSKEVDTAEGSTLAKTFLELMKVQNLIDVQMAYQYKEDNPNGPLIRDATALIESRYDENTLILETGMRLGYMSSH